MDKYSSFIKYLGLFLSIVSLFFLSRVLVRNIESIGSLDFGLVELFIFFLIFLLNYLVIFLTSLSWRLQLSLKYKNFRTIESLKIISLTQIAKYIPGNIGHLIGRYYLVRKNISKQDMAYTFFIENIVLIASCLSIGSFYFFYFDYRKYISINKIILTISFTLIIFILILFISKFIRKKVEILTTDFMTIFKVYILFLIMIFAGGLSIYILTITIDPISNIGFLICLSGFALSFIIGYITPGSPGGIGVREYSFVLLFKPFIGEATALQVIFLFRIISIITDVAIFIVAKFFLKDKTSVNN